MWYLIVGLQIKLSREKNSIYFFYLNNRLLPHLCKFVPPRIPHSATILMCKPKINHRRRWSSYSMTECCRNWSNAICFGISRNHFVTSVSWNFMVSIGCCGILCYGGKFFSSGWRNVHSLRCDHRFEISSFSKKCDEKKVNIFHLTQTWSLSKLCVKCYLHVSRLSAYDFYPVCRNDILW